VEYWASEEYGTRFDLLHEEQGAALEARLRSELRANTFDPSRGRSPFLPCGAQAIGAVQDHYTALFGDAVEFDELRESYAMPRSVIPDADRREAFTSFIFWAS
jgi:nitric oxide reductase subunit B